MRVVGGGFGVYESKVPRFEASGDPVGPKRVGICVGVFVQKPADVPPQIVLQPPVPPPPRPRPRFRGGVVRGGQKGGELARGKVDGCYEDVAKSGREWLGSVVADVLPPAVWHPLDL